MHDKHTIKVSFPSSYIHYYIHHESVRPGFLHRYVPARKRDDEIAQHLMTDANYSLIFPLY